MISKITPRDILSLANSNKCSSYVFAMAETLDNLFKGLRIQPRRDKQSGVIVFQKIEDLQKIESEKKESKYICLRLAYYYIRIFQIFGALALTVVDDPGSMEVLGAVQRIPQRQQVIPGRGFQPAFVGGADGLAKYLPLKPISYEDIPSQLRNNVVYLIDHDNPEDTRKIYYYTPRQKQTQNHNIFREYDIFNLRAKVSIGKNLVSYGKNETSNNEALFTIENYSFEPKFQFQIPKELTNEIKNYLKDQKRTDKLIKDYDNNWYVLHNGEKHIFKNAIPYLFNKLADQIKKYIEKKPIKEYESRERQDQYRQQGYRQQYDQRGQYIVGELGPLQTDYIIKTLESYKSSSKSFESKALSYCTARALQLLDATNIQRPTQITPKFSSICLSELPFAPKSVPKPGARLDQTVPGLHALEQLHHTEYSLKTDGKFHVDVPTNDQEYAKFLQSISELFGKPQRKAVTDFSSIVGKDAPAKCADAVGKILQISNPKTIGTILNITNRMFGRQLEHTRNVIDFMRKYLINFQTVNVGGAKQTVFLLHPRILQNGIAEVNQVGKMARQLLLKYYTDCETAYNQGIQIISQSTDVKPIIR
jgi:hypothetical protein